MVGSVVVKEVAAATSLRSPALIYTNRFSHIHCNKGSITRGGREFNNEANEAAKKNHHKRKLQTKCCNPARSLVYVFDVNDVGCGRKVGVDESANDSM